MTNTIETGLDYNKDGHCDMEGWFVNEYGKHRPRLLFDPNFDLVKEHAQCILPIHEVLKHYQIADYEGLAQGSIDSIYCYSMNDKNKLSCPNINYLLRNSIEINDFEVQTSILNIDEAMEHFIIKNPIILFRGITLTKGSKFYKTIISYYKIYKESKRPIDFTDKGFVSLSRDISVAFNFAEKPEQLPLILYYDISEGMRAIPLDYTYNLTSKSYEKEVLLERNAPAKLIHIEKGIYNNREFLFGVVTIGGK